MKRMRHPGSRISLLILFGFPILLLGSCNGHTTNQLLNGDFIDKSTQLAPTLINPLNNGNISIATQFSWTGATDARSYRIEISTNTDVSSPILRATTKQALYTIQASDLIGVTGLAEQTYYWRVVTVFPTKEAASSIFKCVLYDKDIIYADVGSSASAQLGTMNAPFKTIQAAINFAALNQKTKVYVAKGTYNETIILALAVSVYGGYDSANGWSRNISGNVTTIANSSSLITITSPSNATTTTIIDGFTITNNFTGNTSYAIYNSGASPTISNNNISVSGASSTTICIYNINNSAPIISSNTITGGASPTNIAIRNESSSPAIFNNVVVGGSSGGTTINIGIDLITASPVISNNTILGGNGNLPYGIQITSTASTASAPIIRNNIIGNTIPAGSAVQETATGTTDPAIFQNNDLIGSSTLYRDYPGNTPITAANFSLQTISTGSGTLTLPAMGNVNINDLAGQLFVNQVGNDYHLTTNAVICNVRGGGLNLSGSLTTDKDLITRTTGNPSGGCTSWSGITGATGWSMGAYESN